MLITGWLRVPLCQSRLTCSVCLSTAQVPFTRAHTLGSGWKAEEGQKYLCSLSGVLLTHKRVKTAHCLFCMKPWCRFETEEKTLPLHPRHPAWCSERSPGPTLLVLLPPQPVPSDNPQSSWGHGPNIPALSCEVTMILCDKEGQRWRR